MSKLDEFKAALAALGPEEWSICKHATPAYAPQYGIYAGDSANGLAIVRGREPATFIALARELAGPLIEAVGILESLASEDEDDWDGNRDGIAMYMCDAKSILRKLS